MGRFFTTLSRPWTPLFGSEGALAGVALVVTTLFFWPTLTTYPSAWARYGYAHGWLIAALVLLWIWRDRDRLLATRGWNPTWLVPLGGLSLLWLAATVAHLQLFHQLILVLVLACWGLAFLGSSAARVVVPMAATFFVALPIWDSLRPVLRSVTTVASGSFVRLLGIDATIQGNVIQMPAGTIIVADGCAGLNTFMSALTIGVVYAGLFARDWRRQAAVVGAGVAIAVIGNWIRVTILTLAGQLSGMQSWLLDNHLWLGWVIFVVGLAPFLWIAQRLTTQPERAGSSTEAVEGAASRSRSDGAADGDAWPLRRRAWLATGVAVVGPVLYFTFSLLPAAEVPQVALADFAEGEGWGEVSGMPDQALGWRPAFSGESQYRRAVFTDGGDRFIYGDHFVYRDQSPGAELIGYPNRIAPSSELVNERLVGPVDARGTRWVHQAIIRVPDGAVLTWYWYRVGGVEAALAARAKLLEVPAFFRRHTVSELIAFSAACGPENCAGAFETLADFLGDQRLARGD